jgi:hypothetical protein
VISAFDMPKSLAAKELITVIEPVKKLVMATAIVTDKMNRHSWNVDLKHSGRALGSWSLVGGVIGLPSSASASAAMVHERGWKEVGEVTQGLNGER